MTTWPQSLAVLRRTTLAQGYHWFSDDTMRFHGTSLTSIWFADRVFVTREADDPEGSSHSYYVRLVERDEAGRWQVTSIGRPGTAVTLAMGEARAAAERLGALVEAGVIPERLSELGQEAAIGAAIGVETGDDAYGWTIADGKLVHTA